MGRKKKNKTRNNESHVKTVEPEFARKNGLSPVTVGSKHYNTFAIRGETASSDNIQLYEVPFEGAPQVLKPREIDFQFQLSIKSHDLSGKKPSTIYRSMIDALVGSPDATKNFVVFSRKYREALADPEKFGLSAFGDLPEFHGLFEAYESGEPLTQQQLVRFVSLLEEMGFNVHYDNIFAPMFQSGRQGIKNPNYKAPQAGGKYKYRELPGLPKPDYQEMTFVDDGSTGMKRGGYIRVSREQLRQMSQLPEDLYDVATGAAERVGEMYDVAQSDDQPVYDMGQSLEVCQADAVYDMGDGDVSVVGKTVGLYDLGQESTDEYPEPSSQAISEEILEKADRGELQLLVAEPLIDNVTEPHPDDMTEGFYDTGTLQTAEIEPDYGFLPGDDQEQVYSLATALEGGKYLPSASLESNTEQNQEDGYIFISDKEEDPNQPVAYATTELNSKKPQILYEVPLQQPTYEAPQAKQEEVYLANKAAQVPPVFRVNMRPLRQLTDEGRKKVSKVIELIRKGFKDGGLTPGKKCCPSWINCKTVSIAAGLTVAAAAAAAYALWPSDEACTPVDADEQDERHQFCQQTFAALANSGVVSNALTVTGAVLQSAWSIVGTMAYLRNQGITEFDVDQPEPFIAALQQCDSDVATDLCEEDFPNGLGKMQPAVQKSQAGASSSSSSSSSTTKKSTTKKTTTEKTTTIKQSSSSTTKKSSSSSTSSSTSTPKSSTTKKLTSPSTSSSSSSSTSKKPTTQLTTLPSTSQKSTPPTSSVTSSSSTSEKLTTLTSTSTSQKSTSPSSSSSSSAATSSSSTSKEPTTTKKPTTSSMSTSIFNSTSATEKLTTPETTPRESTLQSSSSSSSSSTSKASTTTQKTTQSEPRLFTTTSTTTKKTTTTPEPGTTPPPTPVTKTCCLGDKCGPC